MTWLATADDDDGTAMFESELTALRNPSTMLAVADWVLDRWQFESTPPTAQEVEYMARWMHDAADTIAALRGQS